MRTTVDGLLNHIFRSARQIFKGFEMKTPEMHHYLPVRHGDNRDHQIKPNPIPNLSTCPIPNLSTCTIPVYSLPAKLRAPRQAYSNKTFVTEIASAQVREVPTRKKNEERFESWKKEAILDNDCQTGSNARSHKAKL
jgi:hypothetical protein